MPKVLVANRGEIAIRILRSARELGWSTVTVYTDKDTSHATFADEVVKLDDVSGFLNVEEVIRIAQRTKCTHVHPGYGFISESASLADQLSKTSITLVGPSQDTLRIASDKISSRDLAASHSVPIAPGRRVFSSKDVREFVESGVDYPVMIKALDGGGGRGIRVVKNLDGIEEAYKRCLGESPSKQLFVEKALIGIGWKHIEVQIIGDGTGEVVHLWERECSVQRRFQKIVEMAPSTLSRKLIKPLLSASVEMARHLRYKGLGTFEYLVNTKNGDYVFLEINPRIQVEHTVTEEITNLDLVRIQLLLSIPSTTLSSLFLSPSTPRPIHGCAIQLRLAAEDPASGFRLSVGTIRPADVTWPGGRGVRIDTWLSSSGDIENPEWTVGTDFDSLLAKIIVHGDTFDEATHRARRAIRETRIGGGVKTNASLLAGIVAHDDWVEGRVDITWLERMVESVIRHGEEPKHAIQIPDTGPSRGTQMTSSSNTITMQPGSIFHLSLSPADTANSSKSTGTRHTLTLSSIAHNTFPEHLSGTIQTTLSPSPLSFSLSLRSQSSSASSASFELADPNDRNHISAPLTGKIVELHPALLPPDQDQHEEAGHVHRGDTLAVLRVMKMESVVSAPVGGTVIRVGKGVQVGVVIGEGMLLAVVGGDGGKSRL